MRLGGLSFRVSATSPDRPFGDDFEAAAGGAILTQFKLINANAYNSKLNAAMSAHG